MVATAPTPDSQRRTAATAKLSSLARMLANVINDRQPDAQKQTPETEWRRQRDLASSINTVRDVLSRLIELIQEGGISQLQVKGQLYSNNGVADVPLDIPKGSAATGPPAILTTDPTRVTETGLKWDTELYSIIVGGGINHIDYHLITDPVTISEDYGLVADPPLSTYDWGGLD